MRKYEDQEWDRNELHPALKALKNDPDYEKYLKGTEETEIRDKFLAFNQAPNMLDKFSIYAKDQSQKTMSFEKLKTI